MIEGADRMTPEQIKLQIQQLKKKYLKKPLQQLLTPHNSNSQSRQQQSDKSLPLEKVQTKAQNIRTQANAEGQQQKPDLSFKQIFQGLPIEDSQTNGRTRKRVEQLQKDPFQLKVSLNFYISNESLSIDSDSEFTQMTNQSLQQNSSSKKPQTHDPASVIAQACKNWTQSPSRSFGLALCGDPCFLQSNQVLELRSTNPSFPGIVKELAEKFIFLNERPLNQSQKQVVYNMALQYFSPSPNRLSDILLISLIKISPMHQNVYAEEILNKMSYYVKKIIAYRRHLLNEQLDIFARGLEDKMEALRLQGVKLSNINYIWMLCLRPNSGYCHQILLARNIENETQLFAIFCMLHPQPPKDIPLSLLYLKVIDSLIGLFTRVGILENVIRHLNETKVSEVLYKPVKSLKLKLIKASDTKVERKKADEDKVFSSYLNEKINKLKLVLENSVSVKSKTQAFYNTESGQYEINGQPASSKGIN